MTYRGQVKNGVVVLEDGPPLAEGTRVEVKPMEQVEQTVWQKILRLAGKARTLPTDAAENHDHYLYGTPKR